MANRGKALAMGHNADVFWARVKRGAPDECWPWLGAKTRDGYGKVSRPSGKWTCGAHRMALMHSGIDVPDHLSVLHSCDNKGCCNPSHLRTGTYADNARDRRLSGLCGARNKPAHMRVQLTPEKVRLIRERLAAGVTHAHIAGEFQTSPATVSCIKRGITWGDAF